MAFASTMFSRSRGMAAGLWHAGVGAYGPQSRRAAFDRLDLLATLFDTALRVPGTNIRFGIEALLRLVPGIGDFAASALSFYLLYEASRLGVPRLLLARMLANVLLEGAVGAVPVAGDAFDVFFRANRRNIALLRAHFARVGYA
ncbi:MAG: DUF4112 domain-containing protein [Candidatus Sulfotelmatobacter sp.]